MFEYFKTKQYRHKIMTAIMNNDWSAVQSLFQKTKPEQYSVSLDVLAEVIVSLAGMEQRNSGAMNFAGLAESLSALNEIVAALDDDKLIQRRNAGAKTFEKLREIRCLIQLYHGYALYRLGAFSQAGDRFKAVILIEPPATQGGRLINEIAKNNYASCLYLANRDTGKPRSIFDEIIDTNFTNEGVRCAYHNRDHISDLVKAATHIGTILFTGEEEGTGDTARSEVFSGTMILESDEEQQEWETSGGGGAVPAAGEEKQIAPDILDLALEIQKRKNDVPLIARLAALYIRDGEFENAELCLRRLTQLEPSNGIHQTRLNNFKTMLLEKETEELKHIVESNHGKPVIMKIANKYRVFPVPPQMIAREQDHAHARYKLGQKYFMTRKYGEALKCFGALLQTPGHGGISKIRLSYYLGITCLQLSLLQEAFAFFKDVTLTAINGNSVHKKIVYDLATIYEHFGMFETAEKYYSTLISVDPGFLDVHEKFKKFQANQQSQALTAYPALLKNYTINGRMPPFPGFKSSYYAERNDGSGQPVAIGLAADSSEAVCEAIERYRELSVDDSVFPAQLTRYHEMYRGALPALVYEPLEGTPLRKIILERGFIDSNRFSRICLQLAEALLYLHGLGIIHGAIDPGNIVITEKGDVKLFGAALGTGIKSDKFMMETHGFGPYLYYAPEKIMGDTCGIASDIYSFGVTMYEMLSGAPPFCSGNIPFGHCHRVVQPIQNSHVIPESYLKTVYRCLQKRPDDRFQSVEEILPCFRQVQP